jgi:hypothetical protein
MSIDTNPRSRCWVFRHLRSILAVCAESEHAAAALVREGASSIVVLHANKPIPIADDREHEPLLLLGSIDEETTLLDGYRPHDLSTITLSNESGATWALKPKPRGVRS